jgi:hypothetical protein
MNEVRKNLYVGKQVDYEVLRYRKDFCFVLAAKEPWHRDAVGYKGRSAPLGHPERFISRRRNRLILNMIDADEKKYFIGEFFDEALGFIDDARLRGLNVLIACNQGRSRAPGIAMLWMARAGEIRPDFFDALDDFKNIYSDIHLGAGIFCFLRDNWRLWVN